MKITKLFIVFILSINFVYAFEDSENICYSDEFAFRIKSLCYYNKEYIVFNTGLSGGIVKTGNKCKCIKEKGVFSDEYHIEVYHEK